MYYIPYIILYIDTYLLSVQYWTNVKVRNEDMTRSKNQLWWLRVEITLISKRNTINRTHHSPQHFHLDNLNGRIRHAVDGVKTSSFQNRKKLENLNVLTNFQQVAKFFFCKIIIENVSIFFFLKVLKRITCTVQMCGVYLI